MFFQKTIDKPTNPPTAENYGFFIGFFFFLLTNSNISSRGPKSVQNMEKKKLRKTVDVPPP